MVTSFFPDDWTWVWRIYRRASKEIGNLFLNDEFRQTLGQRRFANTCISNKQRIIFPPTAKNLYRALDFIRTPDQWIDTAIRRHFVQVAGIQSKRTNRRIGISLAGSANTIGRVIRNRRQAMRQIIDDVETFDILLIE